MSEYDKKAAQGYAAAVIWLVGGIALFLWDGGFANLFRWQALLFLFGGMFVAAIIVGSINHFIHLRVANNLSQHWPVTESIPGQQSQRVLRVVYALMTLRWGLGILFLLWCYNSFFWM